MRGLCFGGILCQIRSCLQTVLTPSNPAGLSERPFDKTVNPSTPCAYTRAERSHVHIKDPAVHVSVQWITEIRL